MLVLRADPRQCHLTCIMCPLSAITLADISIRSVFRSLITIYPRDLCPQHEHTGWKCQWATKRMEDVVALYADTFNEVVLGIIIIVWNLLHASGKSYS